MSKDIVEGIVTGARRGHAAGDTDVEKQASQLASDVKYKVKQKIGSSSNMNPAQVAQAYLAQLSKSPAPSAVKALAKKKLTGGVKEEYNIPEFAQESVLYALKKVFIEGADGETNPESKKYKIRVTDKKTGNSYVRLATRAKIAELRANPNISSVEMTQYGEPSKTEKSKGESTAKAKSGKGLDPVGREDADVNNDSKVDNTDKYLMKRRKAIGSAISKRKGVAEEFLGELKKEKEKNQKITGEGVNNSKYINLKPTMEQNEVETPETLKKTPQQSQVDPQKVKSNKQKEQQQNERIRQQELSILQKKISALRSSPKGSDPSIMASYDMEGESIQEVAPPGMEKTVKKMKKHPELTTGRTKEGKKKNIYALAWYMYNKKKGVKEESECGVNEKTPSNKKDSREIKTDVENVKNQLRSRGLKMSYEPEGEVIEAWHSGKGSYRTTTSGRKVRWDEDDATDTRVSDAMQRRREASSKAAAKERLSAKGRLPIKKTSQS